jgi:hypothetical protein
MNEIKMTISQLYVESYDKKKIKSNKSYQNKIYPDEM